MQHQKTKSEQDDYPSIIECTVVVNHKKVDVGQELVIYSEKPVVSKVKGKSVAVSLETAVLDSSAKRAKRS